MNSALFAHVLQHFIQTTRCSQKNPVILTMDNHPSHISVNALKLAKDHGVNILTLPPHTSHKTQPLDRTVFGPLKVYLNSAANSWMMMNPGRHITIRKMGGFIGAAWMKAATPENITSGFRSAGIWPFDRNIFSDADFASSLPTEQSAPQPDNPGVFHGEIPTNSGAQHGDGTPIQRTEE